jgi:serine O-acetyltransferase
MIITDLTRMYRKVPGVSRMRRLLNCYRTPGFQSVLVYRFGHRLLSRRRGPMRMMLKLVYSYLSHRCRRNWGIEIKAEADIGSGFLVLHYGGIFIGSAVIGKNVTVTHNVTIGLAGNGVNRGVPTIGDNVHIAPGANISGKIRIGRNARIGANAVVQRNVPDSALVQVQSMQVATFPSLYTYSRTEDVSGIANITKTGAESP